MSWISFRAAGGRLKIKPRWQQRWAERNKKVKVVDLGLFLVTWWSDADIQRYG
ncbi:hypothetical protein [uncultured Devosia sp.]|uniref:hypothetical protein n=1 Tax=uncultured Devosia sp. TaxID=211434 RepID=UPI00260AC8AE|nr:hypothetical protein [uncultured Devosia sp.]